jgi:hypothetical protein
MEVMDRIHDFFEATSSTTARPTIRLGNGKEMKFPPLEFTVDSLVFNICLPFAVLALGYLVFLGTSTFFHFVWSWLFRKPVHSHPSTTTSIGKKPTLGPHKPNGNSLLDMNKVIFQRRVKRLFDLYIEEIVDDLVKAIHDVQSENDRKLGSLKDSINADRYRNLVDHVIDEIHRIDVGGMDVRRDLMGKIEERFASTDERLAVFSQTSLGNRDQIAQLVTQSHTELTSTIQSVKDMVSNGNSKGNQQQSQSELIQSVLETPNGNIGSRRTPENQSVVNSDCSRTLSNQKNLDSDRSRTLPNLNEPNADRSRTLTTVNEINPGCSRTLLGQNVLPNLENVNLDCSRTLQNPIEPNSYRSRTLHDCSRTITNPHNSTPNASPAPFPKSDSIAYQTPIIFQTGSSIPAPIFNPKLETADNFIRELEMYLRRKRIPYEDWTLMLSPIFNKDVDQALWWKRAKMVAHDWETFKKHFLSFYGSESEKNNTLEKLLLRRQTVHESFQKFAFEMDLMYRKV